MVILFSQVREDADIENYVLKKLLINNNNDILMIGSGGCSVFNILTNNNIKSIDVIDANPQQIFLIILKIAIFEHYKGSFLDFLKVKLDKLEYDLILEKLKKYLPINVYNFFYDNKFYLYEGLNQSGVYENIFKNLVKSGFNFKKIFSKENLIKNFGEAAVSYSDNFDEHFEKIYDTYKKNYDPKDNYFFYQILNNGYIEQNLPKYFHLTNKIVENKNKLKFINDNLLNFLKNNNAHKYDLIQTSNVTDWMTSKDIDNLVFYIHKSLNSYGLLIMRRLLGKYTLESKIKKYFEIIKNIPEDKSHFYSEIIVAIKK
jgi:S-adenosylmethionine:diacylglycerol 3-amino-3-carboxypropyl transferase